MTPKKDTQWFAIVRHKANEPNTSDVVQVIQGQANAERAVDRQDRHLSDEQKAEGWSHYWKPISRADAKTSRRSLTGRRS